MQRVSVVGNSGAGKSTVGRALATRLGAPYVELDAIFHQAGWTPLPTPEFPPRRRVMWQLIRRTLSRAGRRTELWNGNHESWGDLVSRDPDRNILLWAWTNHRTYQDRYREPHSEYPDLQVIRVGDRAAVAAVLAASLTAELARMAITRLGTTGPRALQRRSGQTSSADARRASAMARSSPPAVEATSAPS